MKLRSKYIPTHVAIVNIFVDLFCTTVKVKLLDNLIILSDFYETVFGEVSLTCKF